jgi:hypothetical protein
MPAGLLAGKNLQHARRKIDPDVIIAGRHKTLADPAAPGTEIENPRRRCVPKRGEHGGADRSLHFTRQRALAVKAGCDPVVSRCHNRHDSSSTTLLSGERSEIRGS